MNLNDVHRGIRKNERRKRIGRGPGSGRGKTATRGHKGQGSRAGYTSLPVFEGGKMPLVRRIPKRGFNNRWARQVAVVNLDTLEEHFQAGEQVSPETLEEKGLIKGRYDLLKVLGNGELSKRLEVSAHRFSRAAAEKIEKAGGQTVVLPGKAPVEKSKMRKKASGGDT